MSAANEMLRRALALIAQRDFKRALQEGERALKADPNHAGAHQLVGTLHCQFGDYAKGAPLLERALRLSENPTTRMNLARALVEIGRADEAEAVLRKAPDGPDVFRLRGDVAKQRGDAAAAIAAYRQALRIKPDFADAWNNLGNTLRDAGEHNSAIEALQRAAQLNPRSAQVLVNLTRALSAAGRVEDAFQVAQSALRVAPEDPAALLETAKLYNVAERFGDALAHLEKAERAFKADADFWLTRAVALAGADENIGAEAAYRRALALRPDFTPAYVNLGFLLESLSRLDEAQGVIEEAERNGVAPEALLLLRAAVLHRRGQWADALAVAERASVEAESDRITRADIIARCADRLGDAAKAFAAIGEMNALKTQTPAAQRIDRDAFRRLLETHAARLTPDWIAHWRPLAPPSRPAPVFLVGFPRSGTTLLDTMLRGHPRIAVLEELPLLEQVKAALGDPGEVADLDDARAEALRLIYDEALAAESLPRDRDLIIDKLPFHIADTVLIHRLFPDARFIFALRHPCDAVLSCYMQNFQVNVAMAAFLDLKQAAQLYDCTMRYWTQCSALLPLKQHTLRYEALVVDPESEMRALLAFLDAPWDDAVLEHQRTAAARARIRTPSYWQVTQRLYTDASGRWERYREQMGPVLPTLLPWAERFGY